MFHIDLHLFTLPSAEGSLISVHIVFDVDVSTLLSSTLVCPKHIEHVSRQDPALVAAVKNIAANPFAFELCEQGVGGTYFVKNDSGERIALFKPADEEPGAPGNPKKLAISPILPPGGGAVREVIAFSLDQGRAGVPPTYLLEGFSHPHWTDTNGEQTAKTGSLQQFVPHYAVMADVGSSLFSVDNVHNIGILDLRLFNLDRNGENLLVVKEDIQFRLVPIDHSYILPSKLQNPFFEWLHWKQTKEPFSPETLNFISEIDIEEDARLLRSFSIPEESIRTMKITTTFLKRGAACGLTLFQIASLVCANDDEPSALAQVVDRAASLSSGQPFLFFQLFDKFVSQLVCK